MTPERIDNPEGNVKPPRNLFADRAFRLLLRIFPPEFRGDYGREMEEVFRQQRRESAERKAGLFRLWGETIVGIFRTAPAEHVEMFRQDGGFALRMMSKNKGFTALVICILALGIGANTAIFSVVNGVLIRPLPYADGSRLVTLRQQAPHAGLQDVKFSVHEIQDYRELSHTLDAVVEYHSMAFDLLGEGDPRRVSTGVVSANFFDVLGVKPLLGRTFADADDQLGAPAVLILSYQYWKNQFGGDPNVVGKKFRMNDRVHTLIGVLPFMPQYPDENDIYMPTSACPFRSNPNFIKDRGSRMMRAFGRLRSGVTLAQAQQELSGIAAQLSQNYPEVYPADAQYDIRASMLKADLTRQARPTILILLATAGLVLILVCANVANLSLARQLRRDREMAIRAAVGASRSRLLRQLVTESTILSFAGGTVGLFLAWGGLNLLISFAARFTPRAHEIALDGRALLFSLAISALTGIVFGSIPAAFSPANPSAGLQEGLRTNASTGRSSRRFRSSLVVAQVAVSLALMFGAGLLLRSFYKLSQVDPGFRSGNVISVLVDLDFAHYSRNEDVITFHRQLLEKVNSNPFVLSSAFAHSFPLNEMRPMTSNFRIEGRTREKTELEPTFDAHSVTPDYFRTLEIPLERGRYFTENDGAKKPLAGIISHAMARHYWGEQDPIGNRISTDGKDWVTIVGVVGDVKEYGLDKAPSDELYVTQALNPTNTGTLLVHTKENPSGIVRDLIAAVYSIDPNQPVADIRTLDQVREKSLTPPRLTSVLLSCFALLALVITAAGIAGVMGLTVGQRTKEIGIRMALGATAGSVLRMVLRQGMTLILIGVALGMLLVFSGTQLLAGLLFGIEPTDPMTLVTVTLLLLGVAVFACFGPARRATSVDAITALRAE